MERFSETSFEHIARLASTEANDTLTQLILLQRDIYQDPRWEMLLDWINETVKPHSPVLATRLIDDIRKYARNGVDMDDILKYIGAELNLNDDEDNEADD